MIVAAKMENNGNRDVGQDAGDRHQQPHTLWAMCLTVFYQTINKSNAVEKAAILCKEFLWSGERDTHHLDLLMSACLYLAFNWDSDIEADLNDYIRSRYESDENCTWRGKKDEWVNLPRVLCWVADIASTREVPRSRDLSMFCMNHIRDEIIKWQKKHNPHEPGRYYTTNLDHYIGFWRCLNYQEGRIGTKSLKEICVDAFEVNKENVQEACEIAEACRIPGLERKTRLFLLFNWNEQLMTNMQEIIKRKPKFLKELVLFSSKEMKNFFEKARMTLRFDYEFEMGYFYDSYSDSEIEEMDPEILGSDQEEPMDGHED